MKRVICLVLVVAFAGAMLIPITSHVNHSFGYRIQSADGGNASGPAIPPWPGGDSTDSSATLIQS